MAVMFKDMKRGSVYLLDSRKIKVLPELNGRHELPDIEWLIQDIARNGQDTPVVVRAEGPPSARTAVLDCGYSRWRAINEINKRKLTPVPLRLACVFREGNEVDGFLSNVRENRFRNTTTPLDDAHNIAHLRRFQMTDEDIAHVYFPDSKGDRKKTKKAIAWVKKQAKLATLTPEGEKAVKEGRLKAPAARKIAQLSAEVQKALLAEQGPVTAATVRKAEGKPEKMTLREVRKELNDAVRSHVVPVFNVQIPPMVCDWLLSLVERM
jgi:ParB-like chromosome segregation protein Spo0J